MLLGELVGTDDGVAGLETISTFEDVSLLSVSDSTTSEESSVSEYSSVSERLFSDGSLAADIFVSELSAIVEEVGEGSPPQQVPQTDITLIQLMVQNVAIAVMIFPIFSLLGLGGWGFLESLVSITTSWMVFS